jgi:hypothetical protein
MTTQEMLDWFDLLQDKYGSPYYTDDQKLQFLSRAQYEYLKPILKDNEGGQLTFENDQNIASNVWPLIFELGPYTMDTNGRVLRSAVVSSLVSASGHATADILRVASVEFLKGGKRYPCKFMRHNDKAAFEENYFKKPSESNPKYMIESAIFKFRPVDSYPAIYITVLKTPRDLSLSPVVNSELPIDTHNEIVAYALQFAGVGSRDEMLLQMNALQLPR